MQLTDAPARRFAVVDVESVPDADSLSQAPRHSDGGRGRPALHRLVAATVMTGVEADGFVELDIRTFAHPDVAEIDILGYVDLLLPDPTCASSRLVTWNGLHDLRLLRLRACSHWMFGLRAIVGWCGDRVGEHVDVMDVYSGGDRRGRWRLADACAGLGFAVRSGVPGRPITALHAQDRHDAVAEHNRLDVAGTFLAYAYQRSFETGDERWVATAWAGLSELLAAFAPADRNVQPLSSHHLASFAVSRLISGPGQATSAVSPAPGR